MEPSQNELEEFKQNIENYKAYRGSQRAIIESALTGLIVAIIIIFVDGFNATIKLFYQFNERNTMLLYVLDVLVLLIFSVYFNKLLVKSREDIFKPVISAKNMMATVEEPPITLKGEDGNDWQLIHFKNAIFKKEKSASTASPK